MTNSFKWLYEKVSLIQYLEKICALSWHIHSPESGGPTRDTALSDRNPETYNTACCSVCRSAWTAKHSTVCSAPFRTSYYLIKAYARRAIYRLQAGASVSVTPTFHLPHCMTTPYANLPITDSSGRKYADRGITLPQLLPGAFKKRAADVQFLSALFYLSVCYAHFFTFPYSTATYAKQATYRLEVYQKSWTS